MILTGSQVYVGTTPASRVYVGNVLVWPNYQEEIHLLTTVGTSNIPIPSWARYADVVLIGGGHGGNAGNSGTSAFGPGGTASAWVTSTWDLRSPVVTAVSVTVGDGGAGGQTPSQIGSDGQPTTASTGGHTLTSPGGSTVTSTRTAGSPGDVTYGGVLHVGGVGAAGSGSVSGSGAQPGASSTAPGAGGPGGLGGFVGQYQRGGPGTRGQAWIKFRSQ